MGPRLPRARDADHRQRPTAAGRGPVTEAAAPRSIHMAMLPRIQVRRSRFAAATTLGVVIGSTIAVGASALATTRPAHRHPHLTERRVLSIARGFAASAGDKHPVLIQHSAGTRAAANRVAGGDVAGGSDWSYLIAMRGHFVLNDTSSPPGSAAPSGTVLTLIVNARTGTRTDFGVSNRYPNLKKLGTVTTDLRARVVPKVTGRTLPGAYHALHAAGYRVSYPDKIVAGSPDFYGCYAQIKSESPAAGTRLRHGRTVTLTPDPLVCPVGSPGVSKKNASHKVPDFHGKTVSVVARWAAHHDLAWEAGELAPLVKGDAPKLLANYRVTAQKPKPGTKLKYGHGGSSHGGAVGWFTVTPVRVKTRPLSR
jgi:hypothetical protein